MDDDDLWELCGVRARDIGALEDSSDGSASESEYPTPLLPTPPHRAIDDESDPPPRVTRTHLPPPPQACPERPNGCDHADASAPPLRGPPTLTEGGVVNLSTMKAAIKAEVSERDAMRVHIPERDEEWALAHITRTQCVRLDSGAELDAFVLDGVLTDDECDAIVEVGEDIGYTFWNSDASTPEALGDKKRFRDADTIEMTHRDFARKVFRRIQPHLRPQELSLQVHEGVERWERDIEGTWDACDTNDDILLSRYKAGGHFAPHTDGYSVKHFNLRSMYTALLYLNTCDPPDAGGTKLFRDTTKGNLFLDENGE